MPVNYTPLVNNQLSNAATFNGPLQQLDDAVEGISLGTKPLASPAVTSFVNSQHNHQNAAGGGLLSAAALGSGILTPSLIPEQDMGGRISISSSDPFARGTSGLTLYYLPARHRYVGLWDGADWRRYQLPSTPLSVTLPSATPQNAFFGLSLRWNGSAIVMQAAPVSLDTYARIVTGATNATPIVITCPAHLFQQDDIVTITGVLGNTAANGTFRVRNITPTTFELQTLAGVNVAGSGAYTSGGFIRARTRYDTSFFDGVSIGASGFAVAPTYTDGVLTYGASDKAFRFIGVAQLDTTGTGITLSAANWGIANVYNKIPVDLALGEGTAHTYTTAAIRVWRNDFATRRDFVQADITYPVLEYYGGGTVSWVAGAGTIRMGSSLNDITTINFQADAVADVAGSHILAHGGGVYPRFGPNNLYAMELGAATSPNFNVFRANYLIWA